MVLARLDTYLKENPEPFSSEWIDFSSEDFESISTRTPDDIIEKIWKRYRILGSFEDSRLNITRYEESTGTSQLDSILNLIPEVIKNFKETEHKALNLNLATRTNMEMCYLLNKIFLMLPKGYHLSSKGVIYKF